MTDNKSEARHEVAPPPRSDRGDEAVHGHSLLARLGNRAYRLTTTRHRSRA